MLDGCLSSLRSAVAGDDEIIVVDSASQSDETKHVAESHHVAYVRCDEPGASRARNAGWRAARHDLVAFVDDDVRVADGWADAISGAFDSDPDVTFVAGRIGVPPGQEDAPRPVSVTAGDMPVVRSAGLLDDLGHSANLAVRRRALAGIGGFDEELGAGGSFRAAEDRDLYDRLQSAGGKGRYEPLASAYHVQWRSPSQLVALDFSYGYGAGARVAKLLRSRPANGLRAAKGLFWAYGLVDIYRQARERRGLLAAAAVSRLAGAVCGFTRALVVRVEDGRFVRRKR